MPRLQRELYSSVARFFAAALVMRNACAAWAKKDGMPDAEFQGYQYFNFPFEHAEFTESGVMGNPERGSAGKGEVAFRRFSNHLIDAVHELEKVDVEVHDRDWTKGKTMSA